MSAMSNTTIEAHFGSNENPAYSSLLPSQAFYLACTTNDETKVKELLDEGTYNEADVLQKGFEGSVENGARAVVKLLLDHGAQITPNTGKTLLRPPPKGIYEELLAHGWDIQHSNVLSSRSVLEDEELLRWLLDHGADPDFGEEPRLRVPIVYNTAASFMDPSTFKYLLSHNKDRSLVRSSQPLHEAAAARNVDLLTWLVRESKLKLDINELDQVAPAYSKGTPMHYAVEHLTEDSECIETIQSLLGLGAKVSKKNKLGQKPIDRVLENFGGEVPDNLQRTIELLTPGKEASNCRVM